jgi:hypothetical protein
MSCKSNFSSAEANPSLWPRLLPRVLSLRLPGLRNFRLDHRLGHQPTLRVRVSASRVEFLSQAKAASSFRWDEVNHQIRCTIKEQTQLLPF